MNPFMLLFRQPLLATCVVLCILEAMISSTLAEGKGSEEKPLPPGAIARLGSLRLRHEHEVRSIAFSPDGKKIASVSQYEHRIRVWDAASGKLQHEFDAPGIFSREIFAPDDFTMAFTPDGKSVAAGVKADVCFWDLQSGKEVRRFRGKGKGITALTFSRDGKTFYCGASDNKLYQWDIGTGKLLRFWDYFEGDQPRVFASGRMEKTAELTAVSPDGKMAVWLVTKWTDTGSGVGAGEGDRYLTSWDVGTGKDRGRITDSGDKDFFGAQVTLSDDGKYLTAFNRNSAMIVWDAGNGKKLRTLSGGSIEAVAYSPDYRRVAAFTRGNTDGLSVWDLATGKELWRRQVAPWYARGWDKSVVFSPDGKTVALAFGNNILLWEAESGKEFPALEGHRWPVHALAFAPKDGALISACLASVCEWNSDFRQTSHHALIAYHGHTRSTAESYEAKMRIFQPEGRPVQLRELLTDKVLHEFAELKGTFYHGCFSADGRTVALSRPDKEHEIAFLDVPSRKIRSILTTDERITGNLVLSRDGRMLAASCLNQIVVLIDSFRGKIVTRLGTPQPLPKDDEPRTNLTVGAFSPDGKLIAFGTRVDRPGDYWKWKFGRLEDITPDTPGIRVWRVVDGRELRQFEKCLENAPHGGIHSLRFSPDGKSLAVALNFNPSRRGAPEQAAVPVLEVASGQFRRRFKGHTDQVASVAFSPDGKILATGSNDSTILLWDMKRPLVVPPAGKMSTERLSLHWDSLAEQNAATAYDAVLSLVQMQDQSVRFLAKRLKPVESPSKEQLAKWLDDLNSSSFKVRAEAAAKLSALHDVARPALKEKALDSSLSLEVRRRVEELLAPLDTMKYSPALMREIRSIEVLERIGSKDARGVLEVLASGGADAIVTVEAKASLDRLNVRR